MDQEQRRILVVRLRSLGDTVLMTPALAAARRTPGCSLAVVVEEPFDEILDGNPHVDRVFTLRKRKNKFISRLQALREIRAFAPDIAIDLHGGSTSALITLLSGAAQKVGYAKSRNARLYNIRVPDSRFVWNREQIHTVEHQLAPLKYIGFPVEPLPPLHVPLKPVSVQKVQELVRQSGIAEGFVLIHPGAAFETKQWQLDKFASLTAKLLESGSQVVVTAGPSEDNLLDTLRRGCSSAPVFLGPFPIPEFCALVSLCGLYVGNDTGATHIAAALGKKIVVIFGSSDFKVWRPWGVEHRLLKSDLPCIPCPGYYCLYYPEPRCIRSIEVEPVFEAVVALQ